MKSQWKIILALIVGIIIGTQWPRIQTVRAQSGTKVTVQAIHSPGQLTTLQAEGSQIVGFSCAVRNTLMECYVASVK